MEMEMYRHGDVLLIRRPDETPAATTSDPAEVVVAEGEVTGHAHRVRGAGVNFRTVKRGWLESPGVVHEGMLRLDVPAGGAIYHEEHHTITLPPGVYEVRRQQTMTQRGVWERVRD